MNRKLILSSCVAVTAALLGTSVSATAATLKLSPDIKYSGTAPVGAGSWLGAIFSDVAPNRVKLSLDTNGLSGNEFVRRWYFNVQPGRSLDRNNLTISYGSGVKAGKVHRRQNQFKAGPEGNFDILFNFEAANTGNRFSKGLTSTYFFEGNGLTANSFSYIDSGQRGNRGEFFTAAHVQGIGSNADKSAWIGTETKSVPEPTSVLAAIIALCFGGLFQLQATSKRRQLKAVK